MVPAQALNHIYITKWGSKRGERLVLGAEITIIINIGTRRNAQNIILRYTKPLGALVHCKRKVPQTVFSSSLVNEVLAPHKSAVPYQGSVSRIAKNPLEEYKAELVDVRGGRIVVSPG